MAIMAMILSGSSMVKAGTITVGDLASYMLYTGYVGGSIMGAASCGPALARVLPASLHPGVLGACARSGVSSFYTELMRGVGASTRIFELKDRKPAVPLSGGFVPTTLEGRVELRDVTFRYPTRPDVAILQKSSMVFAPKYAGVAARVRKLHRPLTGSVVIRDARGQDDDGDRGRIRLGQVDRGRAAPPVLRPGRGSMRTAGRVAGQRRSFTGRWSDMLCVRRARCWSTATTSARSTPRGCGGRWAGSARSPSCSRARSATTSPTAGRTPPTRR